MVGRSTPISYDDLPVYLAERSVVDEATGCVLWTGARFSTGYGSATLRGLTSSRNFKAHRIAYAVHHRLQIEELPALLRHTCDTPLCINPNHLVPGTMQDNTDDKMQRGRWRGKESQKGDENSAAKLSRHDVVLIKAMIHCGLNNTEIASSFGVTHHTISLIRLKKLWVDF